MISPALNESSNSASTFGLNEKKGSKKAQKTQIRLKYQKTEKKLKKAENNLQTRMISPALNESSTSASTFGLNEKKAQKRPKRLK